MTARNMEHSRLSQPMDSTDSPQANLSFADDLSKLDGREKKRLLDLASAMDRIVLFLLFETGLEMDHLINLRVSDVDMQKGQLRVSADRRIQLSGVAFSEIKKYLLSRPGQVYLLEGRCGKPVTKRWKRCVLENLLRKK